MKLKTLLANEPFCTHQGSTSDLKIFAPERFTCPLISPFANLSKAFLANYSNYYGHIFIAATGIAVRTIAKVIIDKFQDKPVVVIDASGQFAISLLSGHWGGANDLTRHLAQLINAQPVITTASDIFEPETPSIDLIIQKDGLTILDRNLLPRIQGLILDGHKINIYDPKNMLPDIPYLNRVNSIQEAQQKPPYITLGFEKLPPFPDQLRLIAPCLIIGIGAHLRVSTKLLIQTVEDTLTTYNIDKNAIFHLSTIDTLARCRAMLNLSEYLGIGCNFVQPKDLAKIPVPNPSSAAGKAYGLPAFSVAEGAALDMAKLSFQKYQLLYPKIKVAGQITIAIAYGWPKIVWKVSSS